MINQEFQILNNVGDGKFYKFVKLVIQVIIIYKNYPLVTEKHIGRAVVSRITSGMRMVLCVCW